MQKFIGMVVVASILLFSSTAFAVKLGGFIDLSSGSGEAEWESDYYSFDIDSRTVAGGFVLDTATTNEKTFNYRLNVGIARQILEDEYGVELKSTGLYAENIFGFALIKKKDFRWWLGPLVRIGYYSGKSDTFSDGSRTDVDYLEFGVGAVTGLNFKAGKTIISPSAGFRIAGLSGEGQTVNSSIYYEKEDLVGFTSTAFANLALLF